MRAIGDHAPEAAVETVFDAATALRPTGDPTVFDSTVHPQWTVGDKPNGGYLLCLLGRAARTVAAREGQRSTGDAPWEVVSTAITYLRPPELAPASIQTTVLRRGRTAAHVRATLAQGGTDLVDAVFVLGELPAGATPRYDAIGPLRAADPEDCIRLPPGLPNGTPVGIMEVLDLRLDPATFPFTDASPPPGSVAELRGWTRFADGREPDALSLLFFHDAIPPATLMIGSSGWVPTLQMSAYIRAQPAPGWLGIRMTANVVSGGMVDETCVLWDSRGQVVAQATQLARLRFPDEQA